MMKNLKTLRIPIVAFTAVCSCFCGAHTDDANSLVLIVKQYREKIQKVQNLSQDISQLASEHQEMIKKTPKREYGWLYGKLRSSDALRDTINCANVVCGNQKQHQTILMKKLSPIFKKEDQRRLNKAKKFNKIRSRFIEKKQKLKMLKAQIQDDTQVIDMLIGQTLSKAGNEESDTIKLIQSNQSIESLDMAIENLTKENTVNENVLAETYTDKSFHFFQPAVGDLKVIRKAGENSKIEIKIQQNPDQYIYAPLNGVIAFDGKVQGKNTVILQNGDYFLCLKGDFSGYWPEGMSVVQDVPIGKISGQKNGPQFLEIQLYYKTKLIDPLPFMQVMV